MAEKRFYQPSFIRQDVLEFKETWLVRSLEPLPVPDRYEFDFLMPTM